MCQEAAPGLEARFQKYQARGFTVMTAASEGPDYEPVTTADLAEWADYFGLSFPVLADVDAAQDMVYDPDRRTRPTYVLLGPGREIVKVGTEVSDAEIEAVLPE